MLKSKLLFSSNILTKFQRAPEIESHNSIWKVHILIMFWYGCLVYILHLAVLNVPWTGVSLAHYLQRETLLFPQI